MQAAVPCFIQQMYELTSTLLLIITRQSLPLRRLSLHLALAGSLRFRALGVHLLLEQALTLLLGLGTVDL